MKRAPPLKFSFTMFKLNLIIRKKIIQTFYLFLATVTLTVISCQKEPLEGKYKGISIEQNGVGIEFYLLNEDGEPDTVFNEGENFKFHLAIINNVEPDTSMFIVSEFLKDPNLFMVFGPVTSKQNLESRIFLTDIIKGESVILYLYIPENKKVNAKLSISRIVHGYKDLYAGLFNSTKGLGDSGPCQKNVLCYPSWENEAGGVALVFKEGGTSVCSGCLLNSSGQDYKGYFLTAFHCVDTYMPYGELSQQEKLNAEEWMFKFNYKKTSCYGSGLATSTIYQDCDFKAAWRDSDFALVELDNNNLGNNMCLSFLGWDRRSNVPTEGTMIHHPSADVMKISFDEDQLVETDEWENSWDGFWKVVWDIGAAENKSSGAPLFDQNKRVVGQLLGGPSECYGDDMRDWFGCFHHSWTGGGTSTTRLSNHLGNAYYMNTIRPGGIVTGPDIVCSDEETFTLTNAPPGSSVSWTASYVTPSSGTGTTAEFESTCPSAVAIGSVVFTISNMCGGTGSTTASKTFAS